MWNRFSGSRSQNRGPSVLGAPSHFHGGGKQRTKFRTTLVFASKNKELIMAAKPIPDGYHSVTPYLTVRGAPKVIEFLKQAFRGELSHEPVKRPDGTIMYAEVTIGDSRVMIAEENEMTKATPSSLYLYVPNVDSVYQQAIKAGGKTVMEPMDMFYGDRSGSVKDPSGNSWFIATHKEDVAPPELAKRAEAFMRQQKGKAA
jgi:PhnB protein